MFQLFAFYPVYDNRDGIVGARAVAHPYAYLTAEGALGVAKLYNSRPWNEDVHFVVVPYGADPFDGTKQLGRLQPLDATDSPF